MFHFHGHDSSLSINRSICCKFHTKPGLRGTRESNPWSKHSETPKNWAGLANLKFNIPAYISCSLFVLKGPIRSESQSSRTFNASSSNGIGRCNLLITAGKRICSQFKTIPSGSDCSLLFCGNSKHREKLKMLMYIQSKFLLEFIYANAGKNWSFSKKKKKKND